MARYLSAPLLRAALDRGKSIEQFLGSYDCSAGPAIRYAVITGRPEGFVLSVYEALDPRQPGHLDIYSFPEADPNLELGESAWSECFSTVDAALKAASERWGASLERWVNQGVCQSEYSDYLSRR